MIDTRIEVSNQFIASGSDGLTYVVLEYTEYGNAATDKDAPELATTQLPSATELWPTPTGTFTLQVARPHGRTLNR
jgi:hypothetical protein